MFVLGIHNAYIMKQYNAVRIKTHTHYIFIAFDLSQTHIIKQQLFQLHISIFAQFDKLTLTRSDFVYIFLFHPKMFIDASVTLVNICFDNQWLW